MEQPSLFSPFAYPHTQAAAQSQDHIGWVNLLLGQLAVEWSVLQQHYLSSISSHHTASSWATGMITHLLSISHSLWVFWNRVVHDCTMDGTAHAAELQVTEDLHAQFELGLQDLPFSERHYLKQHTVDSLLHTPLTDRQWWLAHVALAHQIGHQQCQAAIQGMQAAFQDFLHPLPHPPLEWNFIWALAFFSALQRQVSYFSTLSVAPDMTSSSIRFDMSKKLAMTFRPAINCL